VGNINYLWNVVVLAESFKMSIEFVHTIFMRLGRQFGHTIRELRKSDRRMNGFEGVRLNKHTLRFCISSNRLSASVFLDELLLAGELRPLLPD
jgi:hypothetical protein